MGIVVTGTRRPPEIDDDSDGDGLNDGDEIKTYETDPLNDDYDGDGLKDGEEVLEYRTDPLKGDTDGDGINDGDEVELGCAPRQKGPCPPPPPPDGISENLRAWASIVLVIVVLGYFGLTYLKVSRTVKQIVSNYGFAPGDDRIEATNEFNGMRRWPFARSLWRLRWRRR